MRPDIEKVAHDLNLLLDARTAETNDTNARIDNAGFAISHQRNLISALKQQILACRTETLDLMQTMIEAQPTPISEARRLKNEDHVVRAIPSIVNRIRERIVA